MWVPIRCWLCRLSYAFPDFVEELPDSEEAEVGHPWAERREPAVLLWGDLDIESIRTRPDVCDVRDVWCLYDGVHEAPTYGIAEQFLCGCGMSGQIHVMESFEIAMAQVAESDAEAGIVWSFRQGCEEVGPQKAVVARLADGCSREANRRSMSWPLCCARWDIPRASVSGKSRSSSWSERALRCGENIEGRDPPKPPP